MEVQLRFVAYLLIHLSYDCFVWMRWIDVVIPDYVFFLNAVFLLIIVLLLNFSLQI